MVITIDGLGVNGKTTLARMISQEIGFKEFNTGAIYRCIALEIINKNLNINDIKHLINKIANINIMFEDDKVFLNNKDVTFEIKTEEISFYSTKWATIPEIKEFVRGFQKKFIKENDTVIEGRDIATRIAPWAEIKFYLYSDFETRVDRLWKQNTKVSIDEIRENLKIRDELDISGGNFIKPKNAIEIDTTDKNINEVFDILMHEIIKKTSNKIYKKKNS